MELSKSWNQRVRNGLAENGIEMTPDEVQRERIAAYKIIREEMRRLGYEHIPQTDEEMFLWLRFQYMLSRAPDEVAGMGRLSIAKMIDQVIADQHARDAGEGE